MKQLFCSAFFPAHRDIEECIRAATCGHLSHIPVSGIPNNVGVLMLTPCVPHIQTETTSAAMSNTQPEAWQS
jgi:hypothetical protein